MGREILFRAKQVCSNEWIEGFYLNCYYPGNSTEQTGHFIVEYPGKYHEIYLETLCQYVGLTDKNGRKIFEGDICTISNNKIDEEDGYFIVEWCADSARFVLDGNGITVDFDNYFGHECEVVGNIFDNPDLTGD